MVKTARVGALLCALVISVTVAFSAAAQTSDPVEAALFATAQASGRAEDYQAYLSRYPQGVFVEIARFELEWAVKASGGAGAAPAAAVPETSIAPPPAADAIPAQTDVTFDGPLIAPGTPVDGKSISELIKGSPLFPPIEGLPEQVWKDKTCSTCHNWTKEALCTQGNTYTTPAGEGALAKKHPYGGALKAALKTFALEGCR